MMKMNPLFLLLFFVLAASFAYGDELSVDKKTGMIIVESVVEISGPFVRLKDLTKSTLDDKLGRILISRRPALNKHLTLQRHLIERLIKSQLKGKTLDSFDIPNEVRVSYVAKKRRRSSNNAVLKKSAANVSVVGVSEVNMDEVLLMVTNRVKNQLKTYDAQVTLYPLKNKKSWMVTVQDDYDLKILPGISIQKNRIVTKVGVFLDNRMITSKAFSFKADIFVKSLLTTGKFSKGDEVNSSSFYWDYLPYSAKALSYVRDESLIKNKVFKRSVALGAGVLTTDVEDPILIKKGDIVTVIVKGKGFVIETVGVAKKSGKKGEMIEVMIYNTKKVVPCSIAGNKKVNLL